jgi:hypothetical protein
MALAVTTVIPRCLVPLRRGRVERVAGARLDSTRGIGALLVSQMMHIVRRSGEFSDADADLLRGLIVDLAAATIGQALASIRQCGLLPRRRFGLPVLSLGSGCRVGACRREAPGLLGPGLVLS